ncbi:hypothetical protein CLOM_g2706 [Closterium sp. NIES-68]|nr:hypothetical protein CLOM_g2706 [Closterium sp. NIES-68]GJP85299.1 hypothetical protein CLOP_g15410 [Closterium sp. NIES-67]
MDGTGGGHRDGKQPATSEGENAGRAEDGAEGRAEGGAPAGAGGPRPQNNTLTISGLIEGGLPAGSSGGSGGTGDPVHALTYRHTPVSFSTYLSTCPQGDLLVMAAADSADDGSESGCSGGEIGVWVEALMHCPHVLAPDASLLPPDSVPPFDSLCHSCKDGSENWVCLSCGVVACGRYVGGHMLQHITETGHPVAAGFRDLSVWCFRCDSYLDAIRIPALEPLFAALHVAKFGQPPAKPSS